MIKHRFGRLLVLLTAILILMTAAGCLDHEEEITVDENGLVRYRVNLKGDPNDIAAGDAMPSKAGGWNIQEQTVVNKDGDKELHIQAVRAFKSGESLPDSSALPNSPNYAISLMFPTTLKIERRNGEIYYHFKRVYLRRSQARYAIHEELLNEQQSADLKKLREKQSDQLSEEELTRGVKVLRLLEGLKCAEYVDTGAASMKELWPQDYGLILRQALLDYFNGVDLTPLLHLMLRPGSPQRDNEVDQMANEMISGSNGVLRRKMEALKIPASQIKKFFTALEEEKARRTVTEDIDDEKWKVTVKMPGEIVGHNGDSMQDGKVLWDFPGKALYDRDQILMVTSRIAGNSDPKHSSVKD